MDKPSEGWILYHRNSIRHHLRSKPLIWNYWMHCLEEAAWKDHTIWWDSKEFELKRGSFVTTFEREINKLSYSYSQVRSARNRLIKCSMIRIQSSRKGSLVEVCKYDYWQDWEKVRDVLNRRYSADNPHEIEHKSVAQVANKVSHTSLQQNKGNKGNKENNIISARPHLSKDEIKQAQAKQRGCSDPSFYTQIIKSKCAQAFEQGNLSLDDITDSWKSGIHYNDVIELFKD
jgi:hypothetical protein